MYKTRIGNFLSRQFLSLNNKLINENLIVYKILEDILLFEKRNKVT